MEDGQIVSCPGSEAMDFYFAIMQDLNIDDTVHTVDTVDNYQYGITMKVINKETREEMSAILGNNEGGAGRILHQGLLATKLEDDGWRVVLSGIFMQEKAMPTISSSGAYTMNRDILNMTARRISRA